MLIKKIMASLVTLFVFIFGGVGTAFAHAQLITTSPLAGAELDSLLSRITLEFGEEMLDFGDGNQISVKNPEGVEISTGATVLNGAMVYREILTDAMPGIYKVNYRAISNDGHKVSGEFTFSVVQRKNTGKPTLNSQTPTPEASPSQTLIKENIVTRNESSINHFWHIHAQHIYLTLLGLVVIAAWALYRKLK